jgi:hypothetical protein
VTAIGFGGVPIGFATDAPRGSAGSFTSLSATLSIGMGCATSSLQRH